jgi:hypothetical protein
VGGAAGVGEGDLDHGDLGSDAGGNRARVMAAQELRVTVRREQHPARSFTRNAIGARSIAAARQWLLLCTWSTSQPFLNAA